ncbi:MAG TPA: hypothetical protein VGR30_10715 [Candidatus Binatia bacterium]|jgi:hypothetical protein|nr:hypothetical protein [Candidatus Binatia bacterium]
MQAYLRPHRSPVLWRVIYIACTVLISSYIFCDVLDLDGSDFASRQHPVKGNVLVVKGLEEVECSSLPKSLEASEDISRHFTANQGELTSFYSTEELRKSRLKSTRDHGYRVALPRSSVPDPFPSV